MSKKSKQRRCVHCLGWFSDLTDDHVFPESWYPDTTPKEMPKWKVPSCKSCNSNLGKIEEDLMLRLGLCVDPASTKASGISEKVLRALDPDAAHDERDKYFRQKTREKILKEMETLPEVPTGILPNFGPKNKSSNGYFGNKIPEGELKTLGKKIIRGHQYVIEKKYIENDYSIEIFFVNNKDVQKVINLINHHGKKYYRGPGLTIVHAVASEDNMVALYMIEIWGQKIYGAVIKREFDGLKFGRSLGGWLRVRAER